MKKLGNEDDSEKTKKKKKEGGRERKRMTERNVEVDREREK